MEHSASREASASSLPTSDPMVRKGTVIALEEPLAPNPTMEPIKVQPLPTNGKQVRQQLQRQNQGKEREYKLENRLSESA